MINNSTVFQKSQIIEEEIALEGLDGITLQALFVRLSYFNEFHCQKVLSDDSLKHFVWYLARQLPVVEFYQLPEPRLHLTVFNRFEHVEEVFGTIVEQENKLDVYPVSYIENNSIQGSCSTYNTRKKADVRAMSYKDVVEKYGDCLVLVASQRRRNRALGIDERLDAHCNPLTVKQYVMLERIGRSRSIGELSHGKNSLAALRENPKSLFYIRKRLLHLNLIIKQAHRQRSLKGLFNMASLFHLNKFYIERKSKLIIMIEAVIKAIKESENLMCPLEKIKGILNVSVKVRKRLFESAEFLKLIKTVMVPYQELHPEYVRKSTCKGEKTMRYFTLVDQNIIAEDVGRPVDEEHNEEDESDIYSGYINIENQNKVAQSISRCIGPIYYAYDLSKQAGPDGLSQVEIANAMGFTKLDARSVCRAAVNKQMFSTLMKDIGRQRVSRYMARCYLEKGGIIEEYNAERQKLFSFIDVKPMLNLIGAVPFSSTEFDARLQPSTSGNQAGEASENAASIERRHVGAMLAQPATSAIIQNVQGSPTIDGTIESEIIEEPQLITTAEDKMAILENGPSSGYGLESSTHITAKVMKRANIILDLLQKQKIIEGYVYVTKVIVASEEKEGFTGKMDKKSLLRIIDRLAKSGMVKLIKVVLNRTSYSKTLNYIVDPSITRDSPEFLASVECNKQMFLIKSFFQENHEANVTKPIPDEIIFPEIYTLSVGESVEELKKMNNRFKVVTNTIQRPSVNKGVGSKFVRMRELHHMLFYLVYDYCGSEDLDQNAAWKSITNIHGAIQEGRESYPRIYYMERSWKMFIPPLPKHVTSTVAGWVFVVDILLRLPLCLFVCIVNASSYEEEIRPYLSHPIKKFLLVKDLPPELRHMMLRGRKYVTYIMELLQRLSHIGLIQLGNQVLNQKDHVFIYINRNALLVDTTTTLPSYYQISTDREYVRDQYYFAQYQDVISYWLDMETICLHTPLGCHSTAEGKDITFEHISKRPDFSTYMAARNFDEAPQWDTGYIPGDGLGAAGLDSSMYSHLRRNWCLKANKFYSSCRISNNTKPVEKKTPSANTSSSLYAKYLKGTVTNNPKQSHWKNRLSEMKKFKLTLYKPTGETPVPIRTDNVTKPTLEKRKKQIRRGELEENSRKPVRKFVRHTKKKSARKKIRSRKPYYDDLDRAALQRMNKLRVDWSNEEDSMLLMCRVASMKLFPGRRGQISFLVVRDQLHARLPASLNKTSRACQRRVNYMLKDKSTERNLAIFLEEIIQDGCIKREFKSMKINPIYDNVTPAVKTEFSRLLDQIILKFKSPGSKDGLNLPDSYEEFLNGYTIHTSSTLKQKAPISHIKTTDDIDYYVVYSLMFSCLCSLQDKESWGYQLYLAYQKYPDALLEKVLLAIRHSKMTSYKKHCRRGARPKKCLPLTASPYQLSLCFIFLFLQRYQYDVFNGCWNMLTELLKAKEQSFAMLTECSTQNEETTESEIVFGTSEKHGRKRKRKPSSEMPSKIKKLHSDDVTFSQGDILPDLEEIVLNMENIEVEEERLAMCDYNHGGNAAAILSLMATNRILFDVTLPDNMFILQDRPPDLEENSSALKNTESEEDFPINESVSLDFDIAQVKVNEIDIDPCKIDWGEGLDETLIEAPLSDVKQATGPLLAVESKETLLEDNLSSVSQETAYPLSTVASGETLLEYQLSSVSKQTEYPLSTVASGETLLEDPLSLVSQQTSYQLSTVASGETLLEDQLSSISQQTSYALSTVDQMLNPLDSTNIEHSSQETLASDEAFSCDDKSKKVDPVTHSSSRVAMHLMKTNNLRGISLETGALEKTDVVVKSCEIKVSLILPSTLDTVPVITQQDISQVYLPCKQHVLNKALAKREKVVIVEPNDVTEIWSLDLILESEVVLAFIEACRDCGASAKMLKKEFSGKLSRPVMEVVHYMEEDNFIWRMGVEFPCWISPKYVNHWLIHTNKIPRNELKADARFRIQGLYDISGSKEETSVGDGVDSVRGTSTNNVSNMEESIPENYDHNEFLEPNPKRICVRNLSEKQGNDSNECAHKDTTMRPRLVPYRYASSRKRRAVSSASLDKERKIEEFKKDMPYEAIDVAVRPWVRLSGSLNRRVLDRFLGGILSYVMENPGVTGKKIAMRFWPALIPAHTYELVETLLEIESVRRCRIDGEEPGIFSEELDTLLKENVADYDFDEDFMYEPTTDAIMRHAMFIGNKKYNTDFLKDCR